MAERALRLPTDSGVGNLFPRAAIPGSEGGPSRGGAYRKAFLREGSYERSPDPSGLLMV